jgi:hypothetical protein
MNKGKVGIRGKKMNRHFYFKKSPKVSISIKYFKLCPIALMLTSSTVCTVMFKKTGEGLL